MHCCSFSFEHLYFSSTCICHAAPARSLLVACTLHWQLCCFANICLAMHHTQQQTLSLQVVAPLLICFQALVTKPCCFPGTRNLPTIWLWLPGPLPPAWADEGAFTALALLFAFETRLTGSLPSAWGRTGSLPSLVRLELGSTGLIGTLPPEWGSATAFQQLVYFLILNCSITGRGSLNRPCT